MSSDWITAYGDRISDYQGLARAAVESLRRACNDANLGSREVAEVSSRVKERRSIEEKAKRKGYTSPLDATDIVGARIVYMYRSDVDRIVRAVLSIFRGDVETGDIERVDHTDDDEAAEDLGYRAMHFVGYLAQSGLPLVAEVPVEIQVRTVGQHAWALLEHGLVYKTMSAVPRHLLRNVRALALLYELADERFAQLRSRQMEYEESLRGANVDDLSRRAIDLDSVKIMLQRRFELELGVGSDPELSWLLHDLDSSRFQTVGDLADALEQTLPIVRKYLTGRALGSPIRQRLELTLGLVLADPELMSLGWPPGMSKEERLKLTSLTSAKP